MKGSAALAWGLFFLYAVWAAGVQGVLAAPASMGAWAPDLGLVLLFAWAGRLHGERGPIAALLVALARASFGADAAAALAAAALGAFGLFAALRTGLEIDRPLARAALCGVAAWLSAEFLVTTRTIALAAESPSVPVDGVSAWPGALATALACFVLAPLGRGLPGLAPLWRRRR